MRKSRWWVAAATAALVAALFAPVSSAQSSPGRRRPQPRASRSPTRSREDPERSSLGLVLEEYHQFPKTEPTPAPTDHRLMRHARINYIGEVPDGSRRQYVPDLNGPLYLLDARPAAPLPRRQGRSSPTSSPVAAWAAASGSSPSTRSSRRTGSSTPSTPRSSARSRHQADDVPRRSRNTFLHGVVTEWTADNPRREHLQRHQPRDPAARLRAARSTASSRSTSTRPRSQAGRRLRPAVRRRRRRRHRPRTPTSRRSWTTPTARSCGSTRTAPTARTASTASRRRTRSSATTGAVGEIYALGMRDPHRFSWDTGGQHRMYLGHIGQHAIEAVYEVRAGDNLGWSERRGPLRLRQDRRVQPLPAARGRRRPAASSTRSRRSTTTRRRAGRAAPTAVTGSAAARSTAATCRACAASTSSATWSTAGCSGPRRPQMRQETGREATLHEMQLWDTDGNRLRMHRLRRATPGSTCASASTAGRTSTCWPRPTGRSGRSSGPATSR